LEQITFIIYERVNSMRQLKNSLIITMVLSIAIVFHCPAQPGGTPYTLSGTYTLNGGIATQTVQTFTSSTPDQSGVYVCNSCNLTLTNCTITTSGNTSSNDNSSFYGLNAGVLATSASQITLTGCKINTTGTGANGIFAYGTASIISIGNKYNMTGGGGHAIMCSGGGTITVNNDTAVTSGGSSSNIATDRGGGTITINGGSYTANGNNSAAVYSTGTITCTNATLVANGAEALVIEGSNKIVLNNCTVACTYNKWGSLLYQSMSGDATGVDGYLSMTGGSFTYTGTAGGLFYNTNSTAHYTLNGVILINNCDTLIRCIKGSWGGSTATSGGITNFSAKKQTLTGLIHVDANSKAYITLQDTSSLTGTINKTNTANTIALTLDASSKWIVTATSYLTTLSDVNGISGTSITNITGNGFNVYYDAALSANNALGGKTYSLVNGGVLAPKGSTAVDQQEREQPAEYILNQNYPNPFNPSTHISFVLAKESDVKLEVLNILGEHVMTLVQERRSAGQYSVVFNASSISGGLYFCRMTADNFVDVKKMILIK
jgi:hypothetical protein